MSSKPRIFKPDFFGRTYGGNYYEKQVIEVLKEHWEVDWIKVTRHGNIWMASIRYFYYFFASKTARSDLVFINFLSLPLFSLRSSDTIVLIHHIDWSGSTGFSAVYQRFCYLLLILFRKKWKRIIVVSQYWKTFLEERGFGNVVIIPNCIKIDHINSFDNPEKFRKRLGLPPKKIIYLGRALISKGWKIVYEELRESDFIFILSGKNQPNEALPAKVYHFDLCYRDYLAVLRLSSCSILFSVFKEGWSRSAHESLLVGTPVIGSGSGGMMELLSQAGQEICSDPNNIKGKLNKVLKNRDKLARDGKNFVESIKFSNFQQKWISVVEEVLTGK